MFVGCAARLQVGLLFARPCTNLALQVIAWRKCLELIPLRFVLVFAGGCKVPGPWVSRHVF